MKRIWLAVGIIALLGSLSWLHVNRLGDLTDDLIGRLNTVEHCLSREDWSGAEQAAQEVYREWERQAFYLHTTLRHTDIDAIRSSMRETSAYLARREDMAECLAVTARLINQLELLLEAEEPTLKNVL